MERIAQDREESTFSVNLGAAVHPDDGGTIEMLLGAADRALYEMKRRPRGEMPLPAREAPPRE